MCLSKKKHASQRQHLFGICHELFLFCLCPVRSSLDSVLRPKCVFLRPKWVCKCPHGMRLDEDSLCTIFESSSLKMHFSSNNKKNRPKTHRKKGFWRLNASPSSHIATKTIHLNPALPSALSNTSPQTAPPVARGPTSDTGRCGPRTHTSTAGQVAARPSAGPDCSAPTPDCSGSKPKETEGPGRTGGADRFRRCCA